MGNNSQRKHDEIEGKLRVPKLFIQIEVTQVDGKNKGHENIVAKTMKQEGARRENAFLDNRKSS